MLNKKRDSRHWEQVVLIRAEIDKIKLELWKGILSL